MLILIKVIDCAENSITLCIYFLTWWRLQSWILCT